MKRWRHLSPFVWSIFLFYIFSGSHWCEKKLNTWFFQIESVSDKRHPNLRSLWYMFYVVSKPFLFVWSPFSFNSTTPNWDFEANMLSDRWMSTFRSIWHPKNSLSQIHLLTVHSNSVRVGNFVECWVHILHDFCVEMKKIGGQKFSWGKTEITPWQQPLSYWHWKPCTFILFLRQCPSLESERRCTR